MNIYGENEMKRQLWNGFIIILCGGLVMVTWLRLLPYTLQRFREEAFCSEVTVSGEEIYPYRTDYSDPKKKLDKAIQTLKDPSEYNFETVKLKDIDQNKSGELRNGMSGELRQGIEKLRNFIKSAFDNEILKALDQDYEDKDLYLYFDDDKEYLLAMLISNDESKDLAYSIYFEPEYGLPVSGTFIGQSLFPEGKKTSWERLLDTYGETLKIPFKITAWEEIDRAIDRKDETGDSDETKTDGEKEKYSIVEKKENTSSAGKGNLSSAGEGNLSSAVKENSSLAVKGNLSSADDKTDKDGGKSDPGNEQQTAVEVGADSEKKIAEFEKKYEEILSAEKKYSYIQYTGRSLDGAYIVYGSFGRYKGVDVLEFTLCEDVNGFFN